LTVHTLLTRYPEIAEHLPMLRDKQPIHHSDSPSLLIRKVWRTIVSSPQAVSVMMRLLPFFEAHQAGSAILPHLYNWLISASIFRGYRQGLESTR
jgi:hypothetical protein